MWKASSTHAPVQAILDVGEVLGRDDDARLREAVLLPQLGLPPGVEVLCRQLGIRSCSIYGGRRGAGALRRRLSCIRDASFTVSSRICLAVLPDCVNCARDVWAAASLPVHPGSLSPCRPLEWRLDCFKAQ